MAGHSKWANIQHRKGRQDEKRGKIWTRVIREIMVAARLGGGDLSINPRLRLAVEKAKAANLAAETVKRNIEKATGTLEGVSYEEIRYEGYGIGGAAIIVDTMTDNRVSPWPRCATLSANTAATWAPKARWRSSSSTAGKSSLPRAPMKTNSWKWPWKPGPRT